MTPERYQEVTTLLQAALELQAGGQTLSRGPQKRLEFAAPVGRPEMAKQSNGVPSA